MCEESDCYYMVRHLDCPKSRSCFYLFSGMIIDYMVLRLSWCLALELFGNSWRVRLIDLILNLWFMKLAD